MIQHNQPEPHDIVPQPHDIPDELQRLRQWVCWRFVPDPGGGKARKTPLQLNGRDARVNDPATWSSFHDCLSAAVAHGWGVGFVFTDRDPYFGIDLDDCLGPGGIADWARRVLDLAGDTYCEVSPSGAGLKLWLRGAPPHSGRVRLRDDEHEFECYASKRFFTVTGWRYGPTTAIGDGSQVGGAIVSARQRQVRQPRPPPSGQIARMAQDREERYGETALRNAVQRVRTAPVGTRNDTLNRTAYDIGRLVAADLISLHDAESSLWDAARHTGLTDREIERTLPRALAQGIQAGPPPYLPDFAATPAPAHRDGNGAARNGATPAPAHRDADLEEWVLQRNLTDAGNAEIIARIGADRLRYDATARVWRVWRRGVWRVDDTGEADRVAVEAARLRYVAAARIDDLEHRKRVALWAIRSEDSRRVNAALALAAVQPQLAVTADQFDRDPNMVVTRNGYAIHLPTGQARAARHNDLATLQIGADYDPAADCPRWRAALQETFADAPDIIPWLQKAVGYTMTGLTSEQVLFLCHGDGANGKSVFLETLQRLMGDYARAVPFSLFDADERMSAEYAFAELRGKRLAVIIESNEDRRLDEARVKAATGGDRIAARHPYGRPFDYSPAWCVWLAINHLPRIRGVDRGIWRRIRLVPFRQSFEGREDRSLAVALERELAGILNWALAGAQRWYAEGLGWCESVASATDAYRRESDQVGRWIDDACTLAPTAWMESGAGYRSYCSWCEQNGERPLSHDAWGKRLARRGLEPDRTRVSGALRRVWRGIALTEGA